MMTDKLRIGIIGAGWWTTEYHLPGLAAHPNAEIAALCDPNPTRLARAAEAFQVPHTYPDYREMLAREALDGVMVVTPHATHFEIARDCLEANLSILLEKPMTLFARDARVLVRLAEERQREIVIGYHSPFLQHARRGREAVSGGELGPVQYVDCSYSSNLTHFLNGSISEEEPGPTRFNVNPPGESYNSPELLGGGMGHLNLTHGIAQMIYISGLRAKRVQAVMANLGRAVDMVDACAVEFENGALGIVGGTGNAVGTWRVALAVYCEEGAYVSDSMAQFAALRKKDGGREELSWKPIYETRYANTFGFIDCLRGAAPNPAPGELGLRVVELLDAAYVSVREGGRPVDVAELYA
jgi:predicted dehydrogenase